LDLFRISTLGFRILFAEGFVTMTAGRRTVLLSLLVPCIVLCGCRRNDLVESELRKKETLYRETLLELKRLEAQNDALQREIGAIRQDSVHGVPILPPEIASPLFGLKRVALGRGTGGYDNDNLPGDEALQVVVEPRDGDDHVVKVPGSLHITAIEIDTQGLKHALCWWALTPAQLRPTWQQGLLSTGYAVILPWTVFPQHETIRVVAQFKLADGRCFEADRDVKVRLLPIAPHPQPGPPPAPGSFIVPSSGKELAPAPDLHWSPVPGSGGVQISRPQPLSAPNPVPLPVPATPFEPVPQHP
jgi:hypothetical protein